MNFSAWDTIPSSKSRNPSLSPSHIIIEFERTKRLRIFEHKLSKIDFERSRDLKAERQVVVDKELSSRKYKNIFHVYSAPQITPAVNDNSSEFEILTHGNPLPNFNENCSIIGLKCQEGNGEDNDCALGKCVIGTLLRVKNTKWEYRSFNKYSPGDTEMVYYVPAKEEITLKPVLRGRARTSENNTLIQIDKPASIPAKVYLPPKFYREEFESLDAETAKEKFIRDSMLLAYPELFDGSLSLKFKITPEEKLLQAIRGRYKDLPVVWAEPINVAIATSLTGANNSFEFLSILYDLLEWLFSSIIQVLSSSATAPRLSYDKDKIARPVYSRLPGLNEAYRSDPAFSDKETPAQWLVSGVDSFLSKKKEDVAAFYQNYLDPETCSPLVLDWLAQHVGLTGPLWDSRWSREIKEALIRNSFGWWDREPVDLVGNLTPKGEALQKLPFTQPEWVEEQDEDTFSKVKKDEIETIYVNAEGNIVSYDPFKSLSDGELVGLAELKINKVLWNGLIEAKGSFLAVMFLISIFGLKSHSPEELKMVDAERKILRPKSGLRNAEISAPPLVPHKYDVIQVGREVDVEINNYTNQLIAGISRVSSVEEARNVFFRVPYYYNRNGKSWDRISYIAKNWMPNNLNVRVQYPYLSADLWAVGDAFFEPNIEQVNNGSGE
jgi:hypothetical protein